MQKAIPNLEKEMKSKRDELNDTRRAEEECAENVILLCLDSY